MYKLDKLILKSFFGPFVLTTAVATFVLLIQFMLKYFDDFVGKDLGVAVFTELIFYFSLNMLQIALPLGVLVSSLMTFGNLGENFELSAIKSAGISLLRALRPIFFFVIALSVGAYFFNNYVVPKANLSAYSLLYDIKHKKPALDLREGVFFNGIPNYTIMAHKKLPDDQTLKDVIIYDHTQGGSGNKRVVRADSSRMFLIMDERYLKLELYDGNYYNEVANNRKRVEQFSRTEFSRMDMVFDLSSFGMNRTDKELFTANRQMMNIQELSHHLDSMRQELQDKKELFRQIPSRNSVMTGDTKKSEPVVVKVELDGAKKEAEENKNEEQKKKVVSEVAAAQALKANKMASKDSLRQSGPDLAAREQPDFSGDRVIDLEVLETARKKALNRRRFVKRKDGEGYKLAYFKTGQEFIPADYLTLDMQGLDSLIEADKRSKQVNQAALAQLRTTRQKMVREARDIDERAKDANKFKVEKYKKYSQAFACLVMFLIGAPLGAIIKKGGLGVPTVISIFFFIAYYVFMILGEKWAKEGVMDGMYSVWIADLVLLPFGLFFLRQARIDARLFELDFYNVWFQRLKTRFYRQSKVGG